HAHGVRQHGLKDWLKLARRAGNNLEHLRRRSLLLQRLAEIVGALAQFIEQPGVLDGDDGLGGEVLDKLNLLIGEGPHLLSVDSDLANKFVLLEHGYNEHGAGTCKLKNRKPLRIVDISRLCPNVGNLHWLLRPRDAAASGSWAFCYWLAPPRLRIFPRRTMQGHNAARIPPR